MWVLILHRRALFAAGVSCFPNCQLYLRRISQMYVRAGRFRRQGVLLLSKDLEPLLERPATTNGPVVVNVCRADLGFAVVRGITSSEHTARTAQDWSPYDVPGLTIGYLKINADSGSLRLRDRKVYASTEDFNVDSSTDCGAVLDSLRCRNAGCYRSSEGTWASVSIGTMVSETSGPGLVTHLR